MDKRRRQSTFIAQCANVVPTDASVQYDVSHWTLNLFRIEAPGPLIPIRANTGGPKGVKPQIEKLTS